MREREREREKRREKGLARASKGPRGTVLLWSGRRVRRAEAVTAFLGGLSGTRLPALSYLLPRARPRSPGPPFPLFNARLPPPDQIGRTRYRAVSVASTEPRFHAAFFLFPPLPPTWIFTFPVSRPPEVPLRPLFPTTTLPRLCHTYVCTHSVGSHVSHGWSRFPVPFYFFLSCVSSSALHGAGSVAERSFVKLIKRKL